MPFERSGKIDRTPSYMKRKKNTTTKCGFVVEGAGEMDGVYFMGNSAKSIYWRAGSEGQVQIQKGKKSWTIRKRDPDGDIDEYIEYFTNQQLKPKPPQSGWRNAFTKEVDSEVSVARTLFKNLTPEQLEEMSKGNVEETKKAALNLDETDAKPAETPKQKRARERMERRQAMMDARKKTKKRSANKKSKKSEETKGSPKESEPEVKKSTTPEPSKAPSKTPEKRIDEADEEEVEAADDILGVLFSKLQPRYGKYRHAFEEFGVSDMEMLKEVDGDGLVDLGVSSGLERKVMLKFIKQVIASGGTASVPVSAEDRSEYAQLKQKKNQLQKAVKRLEAKKEKLEKEVAKLQKEKVKGK